ncbi:MAG: hypothetical protein GYB68_01390, partial [Chloroflexi bacterium]|nr:hypothetical protein [Chloroflexota bacterium]
DGHYRLLAEWLANNETVYFFESEHYGPMQNSLGATVELVDEYHHEDVTLYKYRVTGAGGDLARAIYALRIPEPDRVRTQFDALAADIAGSPRPLIVFPDTHVGELEGRGVGVALALAPQTWPLTDDEIDRMISSLPTPRDRMVFDVVQVDPFAVNPDSSLGTALHRDYYHIGDQWYDLLKRSTYATGPASVALADIPAASFTNGIRLTGATIIDEQAMPGQPIRVAVRWEAEQAIETSYTMFAHLLDGDGNLVAQYDAVPGGGLLPTIVWEPGEPVEGRWAVLLGSEVAPGSYTLILGLYDAASGERLLQSDGSSAIILGQIQIEAGSSAQGD